tara:strand:+ start:1365 stop:1610 length:246 start_codon:yes stop_codon:yes gene_type:complete
MRKINISKYEGNTHYSVHVIDSYGQEHHLGYLDLTVKMKDIQKLSEEIWSKEVKKVPSLMSMAIKQCIEIDIKNGMTPSLD